LVSADSGHLQFLEIFPSF